MVASSSRHIFRPYRGQAISMIMFHNPGHWGAKVGKPDQICEKQVIYEMLKLFEHYVREQEERSIGLSQL